MSEWYEAKDDDISIDLEKMEVNVYVKQNDFGSVYITLTLAQINDIQEKFKNAPNK